jgi:antitoxin component of MazEF toxin-antitoxin module
MVDIIPRKARTRQNSNTVRLSLPSDVVDALNITDGDSVIILINDDDEIRLISPEEILAGMGE